MLSSKYYSSFFNKGQLEKAMMIKIIKKPKPGIKSKKAKLGDKPILPSIRHIG